MSNDSSNVALYCLIVRVMSCQNLLHGSAHDHLVQPAIRCYQVELAFCKTDCICLNDLYIRIWVGQFLFVVRNISLCLFRTCWFYVLIFVWWCLKLNFRLMSSLKPIIQVQYLCMSSIDIHNTNTLYLVCSNALILFPCQPLSVLFSMADIFVFGCGGLTLLAGLCSL